MRCEHEYSLTHPSRSLPGRNCRILSLAHQRSPLSRSLGRRSRLRRHRQHRAAADCAALRRQERTRSCGVARRPAQVPRVTSWCRIIGRSKHTGADFETFWRKSLHDGLDRRNRVHERSRLRAKSCTSCRLPAAASGRQAPSKSISAAILRSTTDASPTTAGCRNCPSR